MTDAERNVLYYGSPDPLPERVPLRAGPLSMIFESGDLRNIKLAGREVVRRIYAAVRDRNWGTVPAVLSNLKVDRRDDAFTITYDARHTQGDIDFSWHGRISGDPAGHLSFTFDGLARSTFLRNRIGFCVLHPDTCAGARCRVTKMDGSVQEGHFPRFISPHQPFLSIRAIAHEVSPDLWTEVQFEGDEFEMEDQRNWIDGSFKIYCTPLRLPFPVEIPEGTKLRQAVNVLVNGRAEIEVRHGPTPVRVRVEQESFPLPRLGLQLTPKHEMTKREAMRLRDVVSHLRVDVRLAESKWERVWRRALSQAKAVGAPLEVALFCTDDATRQLQQFVERRPEDVAIARFLLHDAGKKATPSELCCVARQVLGPAFPSVPLIGGTDAYFTELNRNRPALDLLDGVCYSVTPQVHAFDNASLTECAAAIAVTVESARHFVGALPISVTPVTLKPRFNPDATAPPPPPKPGDLPPQVDVRQMSLYGACWTLASLKYLAESGVHSVTFYETVGWRGVMETDAGSPLPDVFRSAPGQTFPVYEVLARVTSDGAHTCISTRSDDPLRVQSMFVKDRLGWPRLLLANMTACEQETIIENAPTEALVEFLDEMTVRRACGARPPFRRTLPHATRVSKTDGAIRLNLRPYALTTIVPVPAADAPAPTWPGHD